MLLARGKILLDQFRKRWRADGLSAVSEAQGQGLWILALCLFLADGPYFPQRLVARRTAPAREVLNARIIL
jgi:hypothetical protein